MQFGRWNVVAVAIVISAWGTTALAGDDQARGRGRSPAAAARQGAPTREPPAGYHEPAFERGYSDGRERGLADGRRGARYDPVESGEYRRGDRGYAETYGGRDAYRTNYRAGFRQGYDDGYRAGTR